MFKHILLAFDGSKHAEHAAHVAADLARSVNALEVRLLVAYDPVPAFLGEPDLSQMIASHTKDAERILAAGRAALGDLPLKISEEALQGPVAEAILNVAKTRETDLIVMGSRGRGRLQGALLGSNSQKVVSLANCPVLIVR